jgi:PncC family amidohydrolase
MTLQSISQEVASLLSERSEKLVLAESCTCGMVASQLGKIPGISNFLCGSAVVYRADSKRRWLGVKKSVINKFTPESHEVAEQIALGILSRTPEADWSLGIVGHLGPDAPKEKDGLIFLCIARRTKKGKIKIKHQEKYVLQSHPRANRMQEAAEASLTHFARLLTKKTTVEDHRVRRKKNETVTA